MARGSRAAAAPRRRYRRTVTVTAGAVSGLVLLTSITGYALLTHYEGKITRVDAFAGIHDSPERTTTEAENYLIVGSDSRAGLSQGEIDDLHLGRAAGRRSDTMILAHVSKQQDKVTMVSLPRDSLVEIPGHETSTGDRVEPGMDKLNASYSFGGPQLTIRTVQNATGIAIDHYVEVNFAGFIGVVDALGTVDVCVPTAVSDPKSGLELSAGHHDLDGEQSLRYVRARSIDVRGDLGRIERQQKFIGAMMREALSAGTLLNPLRLKNFLDATLRTVRTDPDLERSDIIDMATRLRGLDPERVQFLTVPIANPDYRGITELGSTVKWDDAAAKDLFGRIRDDQPLTGPVGGKDRGPARVEVRPGDIRVEVVNATGTTGLAKRFSEDAADAGFVVAAPPPDATGADPDETVNEDETVIRYDPRWSRSVKTVHAVLPDATLEKVPGLGGLFEIEVGTGYAGLAPIEVAPAGSEGGATEAHSAADTACT
ncbi:MAG: LCP family protein [Actinomycetes bacterium]